MKIRERKFQKDCHWGKSYLFWCPGCNQAHRYDSYEDFKEPGWNHGKYPHWIFNGNKESPTFTPSLHYVGYCHLFLTDGEISFLPDSKHQLAGQKVPCPEWPEEI